MQQDPRLLRIEDFTYDLPDDRIAKHPLEHRDTSKLLVYKKGVIEDQAFSQLPQEIPADTLLVFNQTKVVHARLQFKKDTGGIVEVFCLEPDSRYADVQTAMLQKEHVFWSCLIGGASKWKHGMLLTATLDTLVLSASIAARHPGSFTVELWWNDTSLTFAEILHRFGKVPLPPYLHRDAEPGDEERYQTIFAKDEGSVAAPTAALHFTPAVVEALKEKQVDTAFVTLHVGAGTFLPVKTETMQEHPMHAEWLEVDFCLIETLLRHLETGIVPVGTTSLRTLESLYWIGKKLRLEKPVDFSGIAVEQWEPYEPSPDEGISAKSALKAILEWMNTHGVNRLTTRTRILIAPGYAFKIARGLVTNFHQPQSTLLLLVSAMIGNDWKRVYDHALQHNYRFLSYGDSSLLWYNAR